MINEKEKEKAVDNLVETLRKTADHLEEIDAKEFKSEKDRDLHHLSFNDIRVSSTERNFEVWTSDEEIIELSVTGHPNLPPWLPELEL